MTQEEKPDPAKAATTGPGAVREHLDDCDTCRAQREVLHRVESCLQADLIPVDSVALSRRVRAQAEPLLRQRASRAFWRQAVIGLLLATAPLPAVLAWDAYVLRWFYALASTLFSTTFASYLVVTQAALLLLLFSSTYAAIPLFLARPPRALAHR